ncbi:MAG: hypothetical protein WCE21_00370 [Candidatus Babeliales bacterium]
MKITKLLALVIACGLLVEHQQASASQRGRLASPARGARTATRKPTARGGKKEKPIYTATYLANAVAQAKAPINAQLATANGTIASLNGQITALRATPPSGPDTVKKADYESLQNENKDLTTKLSNVQAKNTQTINGLTAQIDSLRKQVAEKGGGGYDRNAVRDEAMRVASASNLTAEQTTALQNAQQAINTVVVAANKLGVAEQEKIATNLGYANFKEMKEFASMIS